MIEEEEVEFIRRVMEDSMNTHDEHRWVGLESQLALYVADDVANPEIEMVVKVEVQEEVIKVEVVEEPPSSCGARWWARDGRGLHSSRDRGVGGSRGMGTHAAMLTRQSPRHAERWCRRHRPSVTAGAIGPPLAATIVHPPHHR
ncbi:rRNA N-glycosidase [Hordeum vulgare]|nr:rRNA N-glycosidase [Hordeum vulgare]